jgi:hypothetical protein
VIAVHVAVEGLTVELGRGISRVVETIGLIVRAILIGAADVSTASSDRNTDIPSLVLCTCM